MVVPRAYFPFLARTDEHIAVLLSLLLLLLPPQIITISLRWESIEAMENEKGSRS